MKKELNICKNCNHKFIGNFCNICGEKKIFDSDFSIKSILGQAFGALTNIDAKFLKTFILLIQNPGQLSRNYIAGIRVPYLKPFQIFLICNLFFFIFLSHTDFFRTPSIWFFNENFQFYGIKVMEDVKAIMQSKNMTLEEVKLEYDSISSNLSKSLLILLIPFIASISIIINRKIKFGKHLIFATHYFSQLLFSTTILYLMITNLPVPNKWFFLIPVVFVSFFYYVLSIKTFYQKNVFLSILYAIIGFFFIAIFLSFYRDFINLISLKFI